MEKNNKIKLGDKVRDMISGYEGIAVARTQFINGCVQYSVSAKLKKGDKPPIEGDPSIDEVSLEVVEKKAFKSKEYEDDDKVKSIKPNGGKIKFFKMRGY